MPRMTASAGSAELHQIGALPTRTSDGKLEVCLVTTRETGRWTIPKGWPMKGVKDAAVARIEAKEEAGIAGKTGKSPIGSYVYWKRLDGHFALVEVSVYSMRVTKALAKWKEQGQRQVRWLDVDDASLIVDEPGLAAILQAVAANAAGDSSPDHH